MKDEQDTDEEMEQEHGKEEKEEGEEEEEETRPDTRLPKSRAGGQGPYLRSPDHLGGSSEVRVIKS